MYVVLVGDAAEQQGLLLAERWRRACPQWRWLVNCGGGNFKTQFKRADKSNARLAFILGADEITRQVVSVKFLREEREQQQVTWDGVAEFLQNQSRVMA